MSYDALKHVIERAFDAREEITFQTGGETREAVEATLDLLGRRWQKRVSTRSYRPGVLQTRMRHDDGLGRLGHRPRRLSVEKTVHPVRGLGPDR